MKILIADDDPMITAVVRGGLMQRGWQVEVAADAMQAVMYAMRASPDAIVLDINMPGGSGITALERLKASVKTQFIPIVVLSGSIDPEARPTVQELGADAYLPKPVDLDELYRVLRRVMNLPAEET